MHTAYCLHTCCAGWGSSPEGSKKWAQNSAKEAKVRDRSSTRAYLEWLSTAVSQGDIRAVELLWTPAEPSDTMTQEELESKWPQLKSIGWN